MATKIDIYSVDIIPNKEYEVIGLVKGSIVQSKHFGRDLMASFKTIIGGELKGYTEMINEARAIATDRMLEEATALGANAVLGVTYTTSAVMQGASEVIAYGTAVKIK